MISKSEIRARLHPTIFLCGWFLPLALLVPTLEWELVCFSGQYILHRVLRTCRSSENANFTSRIE